MQTVKNGTISPPSPESDVPGFIRTHADRVKHVHLKDYVGTKSDELGIDPLSSSA